MWSSPRLQILKIWIYELEKIFIVMVDVVLRMQDRDIHKIVDDILKLKVA